MIKLALGLARATALAISSGLPMRPVGLGTTSVAHICSIALMSSSQPSCLARFKANSLKPSVKIDPGLIALEVIPVPASSLAKLTAKLTLADL